MFAPYAPTDPVNQATPAISWATPSPITYGTALSATQLNASSTVAGTLAYTPASGTVLAAGTQTLSVTLTPTDTTDYTSATQTVSLTVNKATPTVSWTTSAPLPVSAAYNSQFTVAVTSNSTGSITYSTSGGCTNNGATVTMTSGPTACLVTANVAAARNYPARSVGPTTVAALNMVEFNAMALTISWRSTSSTTNACRAGASKALAMPSKPARSTICHGCTTPMKTRPARTKASNIIVD